jgi:hypothetical protein
LDSPTLARQQQHLDANLLEQAGMQQPGQEQAAPKQQPRLALQQLRLQVTRLLQQQAVVVAAAAAASLL